MLHSGISMEVATTHTNHAFRMIVVKRTATPVLHGMKEFLTYASERYSVIASNDLKMSAQEIVHFYRQRGDSSEKRIKELKNGFNLKYLPTSHFKANALYFHIGTILLQNTLFPSFHGIFIEVDTAF